ncbi:permease [Bengtsoniella intestinalis]|uniref:permease n=1 Tax=Bengtsoniella intestinalis TaxID=3073143 RepID=UPI00391F2D39
MFATILYICAGVGLAVSAFKNKKKTKMALKKAWKSAENIMPQFLAIILLIGIMLAVLDTQTITKLLGAESGIMGVAMAAFIGAITLIPGFVAFPLAAALLQSGAGITQITAFLSTLMMVGIVTMPVEIKTFGKKVTLMRNLSAFIFSLVAAAIMGVVL